MTQSSARGGYAAPPREHNAEGAVRRVGLELELAGLSVEQALSLMQACLGGVVEPVSRAEGKLRDTAFGTFKVEYDSRALRERRYLRPLSQIGFEDDSKAVQFVEESVLQVAAELVPVEIVTPPVPWNRLAELDPLWLALRQAGAEDTYSSLFYAFGLHLNAETPDGEVSTLLGFLRAFLLLEDWIIESSQIDISRRISPFIRPFPEAYRRKLLAPDYAPDSRRVLIDDYLADNPTRNRGLDLLPLFVHLEGSEILASVEEAELVKPRPTFHYRLPNCELAAVDWTPREDWNRWVAIERLAADAPLLEELSHAYLNTFDLPLRLQSIGWIAELRARISLPGELGTSAAKDAGD